MSLPELQDRVNNGSFINPRDPSLQNRVYKKHRAILQTLDRMTYGVNFPSELFQKYVDRWDKIPVLYGPQHPDITEFIENPEAELNRVGARVAGYITNVSVDQKGHPRLYADVVLNDEYAEGLITEGHLGLSTGFRCADDGYSLIGEIYPNHVLVFYEDMDNLPADFGAGFLNKKPITKPGEKMATNTTPGEGNEPGKNVQEPAKAEPVTEPIKVNPEDNLPPLSTSGGNKDYLNLREQYIRDTNKLSSVNEALVASNNDLKDRLHAFEVRERNQKIEGVVGAIPREMLKRLEPETIRDRLNKNPLSVLESIVTLYNEQISRITQSSRQTEGNQYLNQAVTARLNNQQAAGGRGGSDLSTNGLCSKIIVDDTEID